MSSVRGGGGLRGRGRGNPQSTSTPQRGRGWSVRGRASSTNAQRGGTSSRSTFGQPSQAQATRGFQRSTRDNGRATSQPSAFGVAQSRGSWQDRYQALTRAREKERSNAIRQGLIADPDKPRALSEAITPAGTCQDMCAEYERVQRVVQKDVWDEETDSHHSPYATTDKEPDEARMVKKFRRAAAGLEEQLPSDLRPPQVLKRTCDYLFDDVVGNAASLAQVHHFVWDRTRAIRNDFSIQQVTRAEELRIAIDCYERIARFHILSLHQLALPEKPYSKYDWQQEREQLDRTLLSLMQYYDDSQGRIDLQNEAEFRAYCVIFQLQVPTPDLEDRIQTWSKHIVQDGRVKRALDLYMAACNVMDEQGPLKPRANHLIARQDWQRFWTLVASKEVSYLMACVAEIYFNLVRRLVLNALFQAFRARPSQSTPDWTIDVLCELLAFDTGDEVYMYCERFGFSFNEREEDGQHYLDLSSVKGRTLPEPSAGMPKQTKTGLVEDKRLGRTLPAVINGLSAKEARDMGLVVDEEEVDEGMQDAMQEEETEVGPTNGILGQGNAAMDDEDSLFVPEVVKSAKSKALDLPANGTNAQATSVFGSGSFKTGSPFGKRSSFGQPSTTSEPTTFGKPSTSLFQPSPFAQAQDRLNDSTTALKDASEQTKPNPFRLGPISASAGTVSATSSNPFGFGAVKPAQEESVVKKTTFGQPSSPSINGANATSPKEPGSLFKKPALGQQSSWGQPSTHQDSVLAKPSSFTPNSTAFSFGGTPPSARESPISYDGQKSAPLSFFPQPTAQPKSPSSAVEQPKAQPSFGPATGTFGLGPPMPSFSSQPPETTVSQPHSTTSPTSTVATSNAQVLSPTSPTLGGGNRRQSSSADTRPKIPSPLSNSITATEESNAGRSKNLPNTSFGPEVKQQFHRQPQKTASTSAAEQFDALITHLTDELFNNPHDGYMKQYIEFIVGRTITEAKDQIVHERNIQEADDYRKFRICERYGLRWRDIFWQRRLAKTGRERRERRKRRLQQRGSQEIDNNSLYDTESVLGSSRAASILDIREEMGNGLSKKASNLTSWMRPTINERPSTAGSKRPVSSHGAVGAIPPREVGHKRLKSTSHVNEQGRITKPTASTHPSADLIKRSAFLGFSMAKDGDPNSKNTTRSNYFRLKAMGVTKADNLSGLRGTKRANTESTHGSSQTSPPALRPSRLGFSTERSTTKALMPPPPPKLTSPQVPKSKPSDDDEALFARIRNAREDLKQSVSLFQKEATGGEKLDLSLSSTSSHESPSMTQARAAARLRASRNDAASDRAGGSRLVPAFWMRESKFVPREDYKKAVERAGDIRASRSREASRPESRTAVGNEEEATPAQSQPSPKSPRQTQKQPSTRLPTVSPQNWSTQSFQVQGNTPAFGSASTPYALPSQPQVSFSNHTTQMSTANPFLQGGISGSTAFGLQPTFGSQTKGPPFSHQQDHTINPLQIHQSLANSFGSSAEVAQSSSFAAPQSTLSRNLPNSYQDTQEMSLLSDDEGKGPLGPTQVQTEYHAANYEREEEGLFVETAEDDQHHFPYPHGNSYMTRPESTNGDEFDSQGWASDTGQNSQNSYESDAETNGYNEDEEAANGDIDEDESEELDGSEEGTESLDEEEGDHDTPKGTPWQAANFDAPWNTMSPMAEKNPPLQEVGNSAEEAIELSD